MNVGTNFKVKFKALNSYDCRQLQIVHMTELKKKEEKLYKVI